MAHNLEILADGTASMFSVKETPWHGLGKIIREAPTAAEAIKLAGLDWTVSERPIYRIADDGAPTTIETHKAIIRDSDNSTLGIVGKGYTPLQNQKAFDFFNPFIQADQAQFETAGALREGRTIWALAQLNRAPMEIVRGDAVRKFLLLSNGHDGTMAVRVGFTPVRVVCANTLAMSHGAKGSKLIRIIHGKSVAYRLEQIRDIVNAADAQFEATAEQYRALAKADVNQKDLREYVKLIFKPELQDTDTQRKQVAFEKINERITKLFEEGRGAQMPGVRGTYWGLYNAVTEYLNYEKIDDDARRLTNLWYGHGQGVNQTALDLALEMAVA